MKSIKNLLFLLVVACAFTACKKGPSAVDAAKNFCSCAAPVVEMKDKVDAASEDEKESLTPAYQKAMSEALSCVTATADIEKALKGKAKEKFNSAYTEAVKTTCPKVASVLNMQ